MEKKIEYNEIKELYKYCVKIGINAVILFSINILMVATWVM